MKKDERDLLDVLKSELAFLQKGGYGRSPRAPWIPQFIFEDSPTCMNYDSKDHPDPCSECALMQLVPPEFGAAEIPCRHIPLNAEGETLESLYHYVDQYETEEVFGKWLRATIATLAARREAERDIAIRSSVPGTADGEAEPLFQGLHRKCANPACSTAFDWLAGGKFFRFQPVSAAIASQAEGARLVAGTHGVWHYWLCEPCSRVFSLAQNESKTVVLKLVCPELRAEDSPKRLSAA
jgi:hypothetical protein